MSKKLVICVFMALLCSISAYGAVYTDGVYHIPQSGQIVTSAQTTQPQPVVAQIESQQHDNIVESIFGGFATNANIDVNTNQVENKAIDAVAVTASVNAVKGPVYIQYSHSRTYSRSVDPIYSASTDFSGQVNNRICVGVSFSPEQTIVPTNVAATQKAEVVASVATPVASGNTLAGSAVN